MFSPDNDSQFRLNVTSGNYTSATMGSNLLFTAQRDGTVEVYQYDPENQTFQSDPVEIVDTNDFPSGFSRDVQANHVVMAGDYLYVANSTGGVLVLEIN